MKTRAELIEVMARAICASDGYDPDHDGNDESGTFSQWMSYRDDAEAALTAIESSGARVVPVEATDEMWDAGYGRCGANETYSSMLFANPFKPE